MGNFISNISEGIGKRSKKIFHNRFSKVGFSWWKLRVLKNLSSRKQHTIDFLGKKISFVSRVEFLHSVDELFVEEIYRQKLRANPLIIDCGANIGLSIIYMKQLAPDARIIAFEPDKLNYQLLKQNVEHFGLSNVDARNEAIWIENTVLKFASQGSLMSRIDEKEKPDSIEVKATRLKELITEKVDFLKIDIEGAEYKVMADIDEKLHLVENLFLEYHGTFDQNGELREIFDILVRNGFKLYIKEAITKHPHPFERKASPDYDVQLNIFCFRN
jgi:FkbM family methyltransferase